MPPKTALVTGATGFLGSHLPDALLAQDYDAIGVDNLCTGSVANVGHLKSEPRFSLPEKDICGPFDVGKIDYVFNFASPASSDDYHRPGIETLLVGSAGTVNTLEIAKKYDAGICLRRLQSATEIPRCILRSRPIGAT